MRVRCIKDNASSFPKKYFEVGNTPQTEFNLQIGEEYTVYGINLWKGIQSYLVIGERSETPSWYPAEAFEITQKSIPDDWFFAAFHDDEKNGLQMILGYDELVNSVDTHYDALIEYEVDALKIFYGRKFEIDNKTAAMLTAQQPLPKLFGGE